ncbi:hypothetical protein [Streptomyces sp. NPDC012888]|uniref:hypothetical protein n=1 Tax=Streptomyces sp. NPDC012888 TaxID=3364855 RepID=UPI00369953E1
MERTEELAALRSALARGGPVNLTGGLGSGKSVLARTLPVAVAVDAAGLSPAGTAERLHAALAAAPDGGTLLVDGLDGPGQAAAVATALAAAGRPARPVLLLSRRPLRAEPGWAELGPATVRLGALPDDTVRSWLRAQGLADPAALELAVRLAGGLPLAAEHACRALLAGTPADAPGAVADAVAEEIRHRLLREHPGGGARRWHALRLLATVRAGDEQLLAGGPDLFAALARLSLVRRERLGLAVREPYRALLELAYQWRKPPAHERVRARAAAYRRAQLAGRSAPEQQAGLVEQGLFLSGDPVLRASLFPPAEESALVGPARAAEADHIGRLMHGWAVRSGFDVRRSERVTERWLASGASSFHLARDPDGRPVALAALVPVGPGTSAGIEPLLQQHAAELLAPPGGRSGLFLGAAYGTDPVAHAQILRHILGQAVRAGHLVVSTASPDYQALLGALGFRTHGGIRDDVYRCGRPPEVFSNDLTPAGLARWMRALAPGAGPGAPGPAEDAPALVAAALARLRDPRALERSPLTGRPGLGTAEALRDWLHGAVLELALADRAADAEAGAILRAYYLDRPRTHQQVARRLHLSRATYFRRLRHGLTTLATRLPPEP